MAVKEKEVDVKIVVASRLTENIFKKFFPEIQEEHDRISRGDPFEKKRNFTLQEEILYPKSMILESEKEWEIGWFEGALLVEDLSPFFNADIIDIQNGREEDRISLPKFVSFAKHKRVKHRY